MLSLEDEAVVVACRRHTLLPQDDCLYALQATIPHLTRSSLHRRTKCRDQTVRRRCILSSWHDQIASTTGIRHASGEVRGGAMAKDEIVALRLPADGLINQAYDSVIRAGGPQHRPQVGGVVLA